MKLLEAFTGDNMGLNVANHEVSGRSMKYYERNSIIQTGLGHFYDTSIYATQTYTTGADILDLKNNGKNLDRKGNSGGATYNSNFEGTIRIDGGTTYATYFQQKEKSADVDFNNNNHTIMCAIRYIGAPYGRTLAGNSTNWLLGHHGGYPNRYYAAGWVHQPSSNYQSTAWGIYTGWADYSNDSWRLYVNGTAAHTANNGGSLGPDELQVGMWGTSSEGSHCELAYLLVYGRLLTDDEIAHNSNIMKRRLGL